MRQSNNLPQDDGSHRFHRCPPSHHEMTLMPNYVQASARAPWPSHPSTGSPILLATVSHYYQQGSTMPLAAPPAHSYCHLVPFASMGRDSHKCGCTIACKGWWHPCPCPLGRQHQHIPLITLCPSWAWGGNVLRRLVVCNRQQGQLDTVAALASYLRGDKAITKLGPSFLANSVFSHPPSTNNGWEHPLGGMPCFGMQSPACGIHHV